MAGSDKAAVTTAQTSGYKDYSTRLATSTSTNSGIVVALATR